jgi:hypothetical protein
VGASAVSLIFTLLTYYYLPWILISRIREGQIKWYNICQWAQEGYIWETKKRTHAAVFAECIAIYLQVVVFWFPIPSRQCLCAYRVRHGYHSKLPQ